MNTVVMQRYFVVNVVTRSGYRQSMRFHLAEPVDFEGFPEGEKRYFTRYALESCGLRLEELHPSSVIEVLAFSTEAECREEHERASGTRPRPAPRSSGLN